MGIATGALCIGALLTRGVTTPPGPAAYVAIAERFGKAIPEHRYVCISPEFAFGPGELPSAIRNSLEAEGWQFYDSGLPADTSFHMLNLSSPHGDWFGWSIGAVYTKNFISRHSDRVTDLTNAKTFRLFCLGGNCQVILDIGWVHLDTFWAEDPASYYAGGAGFCTGEVPGTAGR